jgi:hypothetical protein
VIRYLQVAASLLLHPRQEPSITRVTPLHVSLGVKHVALGSFPLVVPDRLVKCGDHIRLGSLVRELVCHLVDVILCLLAMLN